MGATGCCWPAEETVRMMPPRRTAQEGRKRLNKLRISVACEELDGLYYHEISMGQRFLAIFAGMGQIGFDTVSVNEAPGTNRLHRKHDYPKRE